MVCGEQVFGGGWCPERVMDSKYLRTERITGLLGVVDGTGLPNILSDAWTLRRATFTHTLRLHHRNGGPFYLPPFACRRRVDSRGYFAHCNDGSVAWTACCYALPLRLLRYTG